MPRAGAARAALAVGLAVVALAVLALAVPRRARAGDGDAPDPDEKAHELRFVPAPAKGQEEELAIEATVERPGAAPASLEADTLAATLVRKVRTVEDGLASREVLTLAKAELSHYEASASGTSSRTSTGLAGAELTFKVRRSGAARRASPESGDPFPAPAGVPSSLVAALRRDPDGLATLVTPDEPMSAGDEWNVDRAGLLALLGPSRARLVKHGSRAAATLESVAKRGDVLEARVSLKASLFYARGDDETRTGHLKVTATLEGPIDGSAPPRVEDVTVVWRHEDGTKETRHTKIARTWKTPAPAADVKPREGGAPDDAPDSGAKRPPRSEPRPDQPPKAEPPKKDR